MIVVVCGSRDWCDFEAVRAALAELGERYGHITVIHGAARGADRMAGAVADVLGFTVREFPADWRGQGKRAGVLRNLEMLDQKPDRVLAFQRNRSTGTQHTIDEARRRGIPVDVRVA